MDYLVNALMNYGNYGKNYEEYFCKNYARIMIV